jgi:hypothetical protein
MRLIAVILLAAITTIASGCIGPYVPVVSDIAVAPIRIEESIEHTLKPKNHAAASTQP